MTTKEIIKEFDKEFAYQTKDGAMIPAKFDPDVELKQRFAIFLTKALSQQKEKFKKIVESKRIKIPKGKHAGKSFCPQCENTGSNYTIEEILKAMQGKENY